MIRQIELIPEIFSPGTFFFFDPHFFHLAARTVKAIFALVLGSSLFVNRA